jgi:hypothetical protein
MRSGGVLLAVITWVLAGCFNAPDTSPPAPVPVRVAVAAEGLDGFRIDDLEGGRWLAPAGDTVQVPAKGAVVLAPWRGGWAFTPATVALPARRSGLSLAFTARRMSLYEMVDAVFAAHVRWAVDPRVTPAHGLPPTAWKVGDPDRFAYSNPTEWGYAMQFAVAATERGRLARTTAVERITATLRTMAALQARSDHRFGLFYQFYDIRPALPERTGTWLIPTGDCMLLWYSVVAVEGWADARGETALRDLARAVRGRMDFSHGTERRGSATVLPHLIDVEHGDALSRSIWNIHADEGGAVAMGMRLSGAVDRAGWRTILASQYRHPAAHTFPDGTRIETRDSAFFSAAFTWSVRTLAGLPLHPEYRSANLVPALRAHLRHAAALGLDHGGFSDAMTQNVAGAGMVGYFTPPNLWHRADGLPYAGDGTARGIPHGTFVPLLAWDGLDAGERTELEERIRRILGDRAGYWHGGGDRPYGLEVVSGIHRDDAAFPGAADGRGVFEALSHAFVGITAFTWLQEQDGGPCFSDWLPRAEGIAPLLAEVMADLYPAASERPVSLAWERSTPPADGGLAAWGDQVAVWSATGAWISTDRGATWTRQTAFDGHGAINGLAGDGGSLRAGVGARILASADGGATWTAEFDAGTGGTVRPSVAAGVWWLACRGGAGLEHLSGPWRRGRDGVWRAAIGAFPDGATDIDEIVPDPADPARIAWAVRRNGWGTGILRTNNGLSCRSADSLTG